MNFLSSTKVFCCYEYNSLTQSNVLLIQIRLIFLRELMLWKVLEQNSTLFNVIYLNIFHQLLKKFSDFSNARFTKKRSYATSLKCPKKKTSKNWSKAVTIINFPEAFIKEYRKLVKKTCPLRQFCKFIEKILTDKLKKQVIF